MLGDVDGDGLLSEQDLAIMSAAFGTTADDPGFVPEADLDEDGTIGLADIQTLTALLEE
ncbi:MAG: dockerin type I domain-containing protein [Planctomycetota bacterium]